jgi:NADPH:quinone reductase-like Zn-dependent oxidoreductase
MKAIVVTDQAAETAGMKLGERPEPQAALNDVVVQVHASGFVGTELAWPSTWTDRLGPDRTPSIPGHELAGVVTVLGYGTTGLSVGQRVFDLTDWTRDGTLAEYAAVEARNLAPLPGDVDFMVGASLPISGLTAWQGLFEHGRLQAGQSALAHGAAGAVGSMVTQLARLAGAMAPGMRCRTGSISAAFPAKRAKTLSYLNWFPRISAIATKCRYIPLNGSGGQTFSLLCRRSTKKRTGQ